MNSLCRASGGGKAGRGRAAGPRALALACLLGITLLSRPCQAPAQASAAAYQVEIIVFRDSSVGAAEDWTATPTGRGFGNDATRGGNPQVLRVLSPADYRLGAIDNALRGSGAWHPIAHAAWVQTAANWGTHIGIALADVGIGAPGLSGMVYLERATYLHLGLDITLQEGAPYTINEMRSVKYNEKQYFDHPAFGVIAMVSPVSQASAPTH
ncbi:MAG TPA: CsiV family protein [Steroidobacteraceae bacterium]